MLLIDTDLLPLDSVFFGAFNPSITTSIDGRGFDGNHKTAALRFLSAAPPLHSTVKLTLLPRLPP